MLSRFLPQWCMTFFICLFIFMMQFLFRYINDLVGRGLGLDVIGQLFFYSALSMVPMALPLSILLASIMTFGNLGEHFELTALKSSGISLLTVMKPLIVVICATSVGAFFFQNDVLPKSQVQMWTLLFSARQKSLTLDITPGTINSQIPGYNIYVKQKDQNTDMLYGIYIYDVSHATQYPRVIAADSGKLSMAQDMKHLLLKLYRGRWYEDMGQGSGVSNFGSHMFRREAFHDKQLVIAYDATFSKIDDNTMRSQYIGKNIDELNLSIDSLRSHLDSAGYLLGTSIINTPLCGVSRFDEAASGHAYPVMPQAGTSRSGRQATSPASPMRHYDFDSLYKALTPTERNMAITQALSTANTVYQDAQFQTYSMLEDAEVMRRHQIELQRKFTLSLACLVFFFIGAPLGAIVRKGGLGTPVVISVMLFVVYYIIDNFGYKLARDAHAPVWEGMWLSSAVLLPLGIFLTYQAVNESTLFSFDAIQGFLRRFTSKRFNRDIAFKEVAMRAVMPSEAQALVADLDNRCTRYLASRRNKSGYVDFWLNGHDREAVALTVAINEVVDYLANARSHEVIAKLNEIPVIFAPLRTRIHLHHALAWMLIAVFPVGLPLYAVGRHRASVFQTQIGKAQQLLATEILPLL